MGSEKRHKSDKSRDVKKKRHRSRSRSSSTDREKHRHHKNHKKRSRPVDYDSLEIFCSPPPPAKILIVEKEDKHHRHSKEERYVKTKDDKYRDDKYKEDDKYREDRYKDDKYRDDKYKKSRDDKYDQSKREKQNHLEPAILEAAILDVEPTLDQGVAGALKLAMSRGYLQKENSNRPSASRFLHLRAQNYSIEDKTYGDDDKFSRRDRFNGPTSEFKEKDGYRPNVKLEYIDDDGHLLDKKEAFKYLSYQFHGKGPGKNKIEKRMKKSIQECQMKKMTNSTDTPLGTLRLLQAKQKETQSPFIVLSGNKQMQTTSISKSKH